jgi:2,3-bisphosphoglycerate-independent phosphoglycerate mutase
VEAPDECGHRAEIQNKVKAIEYIDKRILAPVLEALNTYDDYKVMILPDHATPLALRTHVGIPVPYLIYHKRLEKESGVVNFSEQSAADTKVYNDTGYLQMDRFLDKK